MTPPLPPRSDQPTVGEELTRDMPGRGDFQIHRQTTITAHIPRPGPAPATPDSDDASGDAVGLPLGGFLEAEHRYRLVKWLGGGGFGQVYLAECLDARPGQANTATPMPQWVAVKMFRVPRPEMLTTIGKRELAPLRRLEHPRIIRPLDARLDRTTGFVVLPYYEHGSLEDARPQLGWVEADFAWRLLIDLLEALTVAHRESILHLDVKPANVMLDGEGGFVLGDFGIAQGHLVPWSITPGGLGTAGYRAPEQRSLQERQIDARTDLYGVGATVWSVVTGIPLAGLERDFVEELKRGNRHGLGAISDVREDLPPALEELVMEMLAIEPSRRPGSAAEALARVRAASQSTQPLVAAGREAAWLIPQVAEVDELIAGMYDPLWSVMVRGPMIRNRIRRVEPGTAISVEGEEAYSVFLLLRGRVRIERQGRLLDVVSSEGSFLGEVAALTGRRRTASMTAEDRVHLAVFNAADFERLVAMNPALSVRLLKLLADRLARDRMNDDPAGAPMTPGGG